MRWLALLVLVGCGRIGFDATTDADRRVPAPVARYLFDDDPTDGVDDASGNGHTGTCTACPQRVSAIDATGYHFTGAEMIRVPHASDFVTTAVSIAVWVRAENLGCYVGKLFGSQIENSWQLCIENEAVTICSAPAVCYHAASGTQHTLDWFHATLVHDGSTMRLWIGGEPVFSGAWPALEFDQGDITIGGDVDNGVPIQMFAGIVDDLRIWNVALDADDVAELVRPVM